MRVDQLLEKIQRNRTKKAESRAKKDDAVVRTKVQYQPKRGKKVPEPSVKKEEVS